MRPVRPAPIKSFTPALDVVSTTPGSSASATCFDKVGIPAKPEALQDGSRPSRNYWPSDRPPTSCHLPQRPVSGRHARPCLQDAIQGFRFRQFFGASFLVLLGMVRCLHSISDLRLGSGFGAVDTAKLAFIARETNERRQETLIFGREHAAWFKILANG